MQVCFYKKMNGITLGPILRQYLLVFAVNLSALTTGLGLVWPSPVLVKLRNSTENILSSPLSEENGSWIVSIINVSGLFSAILASYMVDSIGRKYSMILTCLPKIMAGLLFLFASEVWHLLLGRAIQGVSDSIVFTVVPMYASEIASKEIRGSLGTALQVSCSIGVVTMLSMGPFVSYITLNIIYLTSIVITSLPLVFIPDSPCFLYSKGKNKKTIKTLTYLRGTEDLAKDEIIQYDILNQKSKVNRLELFRNKVFLKSLWILLIISIGTQLVGFNCISFYLQTILESTETSVKPEIASVIIGCIQLLASFVTASITDRFGRKPIFAWTLTGMALGMFGLGVFFKLKESGPISGITNFLPIASLTMVVFGFSAGVGSLIWIVSAELFDDVGRSVGIAIASIASYICLFLTTKYFPALTNALGPPVTYWVFSVVSILLCLYILYFVPETKGKSFVEIQKLLGADIDLNLKETKDKV